MSAEATIIPLNTPDQSPDDVELIEEDSLPHEVFEDAIPPEILDSMSEGDKCFRLRDGSHVLVRIIKALDKDDKNTVVSFYNDKMTSDDLYMRNDGAIIPERFAAQSIQRFESEDTVAIFALAQDHSIAGIATLDTKIEDGETNAEFAIEVAKELRRYGVGTVLTMEAFGDAAKDNGVTKIFLKVNGSNTSMNRLIGKINRGDIPNTDDWACEGELDIKPWEADNEITFNRVAEDAEEYDSHNRLVVLAQWATRHALGIATGTVDALRKVA